MHCHYLDTAVTNGQGIAMGIGLGDWEQNIHAILVAPAGVQKGSIEEVQKS